MTEQINRVALDEAFQDALKEGEVNHTDLIGMMWDSKESKIWEDPDVTGQDGQPFKTWGAWFADRVKGYPLMEKALSAEFVTEMLKGGASIREVQKASQKSRGYVFGKKQEAEGKATERLSLTLSPGRIELDKWRYVAAAQKRDLKDLAVEVLTDYFDALYYPLRDAAS